MDDEQLITEFVATFPILGEVHAFKLTSDKSWLSSLSSRLPAPLPPLYERLILSYRWSDEVELGRLRLLPNPGILDFIGLTQEIFADEGLVESLIPGGFIQFGKGPDVTHDPVCFDSRGSHREDRDYRIVRIDHEGILCWSRIRKPAEIAPSFRELMLQIIADAKAKEKT
ncbi:MAG: hypothetical protein WC740_15065 [Verrucomicrobiia bacterium]